MRSLTDSQLLARFIERRDEAAFEALVRRHGPMVLGVCRRVLGSVHDAEDAFQATFLVLARKAASLRSRELVGNWLYGTAYRTALQARATIARRRAREKQVRDMPEPQTAPEPAWRELLPLLDQELNRLPDKYRVPVVLCELEGKSRKEVAQLLGVPEGTLSWRLAHARKLLARGLARYGLAVSVSALSESMTPACVPRALAASTAKAAAGQVGAVPAHVVVLTEGVVKAMFLSKIKAVVAVAFVLVASAGMVGLTYRPVVAEQGGAPRALADELEALRLEVQSLRKSVDASRERIKALEGEVASLKGRAGAAGDKQELERKLRDEQALKALRDAGDKQELEHKLRDEKALKDLARSAAEADAASTAESVLRRLMDEKKLKEGKKVADPLAEAEAALKALRDNRDPEAQRRAADALERALQRLKEQPRPKDAAGAAPKQ
jgi:RNA polymerase sigma factor (sigma-70 family)